MFSHQLSIFDIKLSDVSTEHYVSEINGLVYIKDYIDQTTHNYLISQIDSFPWLNDLARRVQHYGYKYDYKSRGVDKSMYIASLPIWAKELAHKIRKKYTTDLPDQVIVNEYMPGQGIANHIDCVNCFTDTIVSLSLCSSCVMDFVHIETGARKSLMLEPRSLVVLSGDARYKWLHGIAKRKSDMYKGEKYIRKRRVSLTFRKVILGD
uniref:2OG-Fe(II) oxygenase n=1 Tax=Cyanothece sp. (strain PCC 7425 / ATCC 29141) TaxID=395961 RepID=B8HQU9_CYAP4